jgi:aldehyde dehydrogenase (NAD+)
MNTTNQNYIAGAWTPTSGGQTFERRNPADTRDKIGDFPDSQPDDVQAAVDAARAALPSWRRLSPDARAQFLFKAA